MPAHRLAFINKQDHPTVDFVVSFNPWWAGRHSRAQSANQFVLPHRMPHTKRAARICWQTVSVAVSSDWRSGVPKPGPPKPPSLF